MPEQPIAVTIYHNPACGGSRNTLALIRNVGVEPTVIEYLKQPPDRQTLERLIERMGITPRDLLREKGTPYGELDLGAAHWTGDQLIDQMLAHPILINRPIVVTPLGVRLCRPAEAVLDILPLPQNGPFVKEDGEPGIEARLLSCASFRSNIRRSDGGRWELGRGRASPSGVMHSQFLDLSVG